jgi:hypothetical protein
MKRVSGKTSGIKSLIAPPMPLAAWRGKSDFVAKEWMFGVLNGRLSLMIRFLLVFLCGVVGCGASQKSEELTIPPVYNNLRQLSVSYSQATSELGRPPRSAEEAKPFLAKNGDPKELLQSPLDGAPFVIQWGVDVRRLTTADGKKIIWVYEANAHSGKRWVLQERQIVELSEDDFRNAPFAPGMKKPF